MIFLFVCMFVNESNHLSIDLGVIIFGSVQFGFYPKK
jgi:hypothetical protein